MIMIPISCMGSKVVASGLIIVAKLGFDSSQSGTRVYDCSYHTR